MKGRFVDQSEIDLIHVPGVVFQSKVTELAMVAYDRYLEDLPKNG